MEDESLRAQLARIERRLDELIQASTSSEFMKGAKEIASFLRCHERTVRKWVTKYQFPVVHLPDGRLATTRSLVDRWLLEARAQQYAKPLGNGRKRYREM